jgi:hypothetical protein
LLCSPIAFGDESATVIERIDDMPMDGSALTKMIFSLKLPAALAGAVCAGDKNDRIRGVIAMDVRH